MLKARYDAVNGNIRSSEVFPRIRDAEKEMRDYNRSLMARLNEKKKAMKKSPVTADNQRPQYFSSFILDKDPKSAQYLTFDKVYFPKLPDPNNSECVDYSIETMDKMWLMGFKDESVNARRNKK